MFTIRARGHLISLGKRTQIMGIINVTPDSFSRDGLICKNKNYTSAAVALALKMIQEGADLIDVGGESTRPGSRPVSIEEEINRVVPVIEKLKARTRTPISIDTYKREVAEAALKAGASIVNNIRGVKPDPALLKIVKKFNAAIVLMHIRGTPQTMQKRIHYKNLIREIISALQKSVENCLEIGIKSDKLLIDPGIGFGKTAEHNLEILHRLKDFEILKRPILIGPSRKSFIGKVLDKKVDDRLFGTAAAVSAGILNGAHIVRVHDVREMRDIADMSDAILNSD